MPRLDGGPKALSIQLKSRGLQRLRWYCQVCEKQCRDENGFKQHCLSESHVRRLQLVGEDPQKFINRYTEAFKRDFLQLLRTSHGEKVISLNAFYQSYISNKQHIHLNATRFHKLTELAKHLGREGTCRITEEEDGKGLLIAWTDNSPEALRRRDKLQRIERQNMNDSARERKEIQDQVDRAWQASTVMESSSKDGQDEGVVEPPKPPKFRLPQRKHHDAQAESKKRKNVFSRPKGRPNAHSGN